VPEVTVVTAHAEAVPLRHETVGLLASTQVAQVRARVAGIILKRVYTEGTDVRQGDVLFQIDPAPLQADLNAKQAALAKAEADAANAALVSKRYQELAAKGLIASQDADTALAKKRSTAADVGEARANVEKARLDLGYATVTAPISGRAGRALVTKGALVGENEATQLTTVEQVDPIYVNFSQSAIEVQRLKQSAAVKPGADSAQDTGRVEVMLPDGTSYPHAGTLDFSDLAVDQSTGVVALRAIVPNPDHRLLPGMFVKLRATMGHLENAFLLPQATVQMDDAGTYVLVVDAAGKVEQRHVKTSGMTRADWIISSGLADGDQVIVDGLQHVKPGVMARVVPATIADSKTAGESTAARH
jgi:membrane fusion protein (multidrug efflux system)